jgi:hypothetical protein
MSLRRFFPFAFFRSPLPPVRGSLFFNWTLSFKSQLYFEIVKLSFLECDLSL